MQTAHTDQTARRPAHGQLTSAPAIDVKGRDHSFLSLLARYRSSGGLATGSEIALRRPEGGLSVLARSIAAKEVICFAWRSHFWFPIFQFERGDLAIRAKPHLLLTELSAVLDGWEIANWIVEPNEFLDCETPLASMESDFAAVHDAARALRFAFRL